MHAKTAKTSVLALMAAFAVAGAAFAGQAPLTTDSDLVIRDSSLSSTPTISPESVNGKPVRVIAAVAPDKTVRTVFDACQACGDIGYIFQRDALACKACGQRFAIANMETVKGGCNPGPVGAANKTETADAVIISKAFLERAA
ncbi:MAG: DUF2318 domain-containing protein, partial [Planctomycetota bacterium]|nr:DUF2318 domain-containing protein [Planctomycetota bacterium]